MKLANYIRGFTNLFFPDTCTGCDQPLGHHEELICTNCWYHMPYTGFHLKDDNATARQLWGRAQLDCAASFLFFREASRVQRIMHHFKYQNEPKIGEIMGHRYGSLLSKAGRFTTVDIIIPVPLHPKKLKKRGYNQSDFFARGLAEALDKPVLFDGLVRIKVGDSQTRKSRFDRYRNMKDTFLVGQPEVLENLHVLLVDDVLTTGATIEACAEALLAVEGVRVSVVTIAKAIS